MENNLPTNFTNLLLALQYKKIYRKSLQMGKQKYNLRSANIEDLTPFKILDLYRTVVKKFYMNRTKIIEGSWFQNQLRIYLWLLIGYLFIHKKLIKQMEDNDWQYFSPIFHQRLAISFQFQALSLISIEKSSKWQTNQMELLQLIIKQKKFKNKWNTIARQLYIRSQKLFYRNPKQCRQRWLNYLDPNKKKTGWEFQQDLLLLKSVIDHGKKWSWIVKILKQTRTQHMVKNRYKSLVSNQIKKFPKSTQIDIVNMLIKQLEKKNSVNLGININSINIQKTSNLTKIQLNYINNSEIQLQKLTLIKNGDISGQNNFYKGEIDYYNKDIFLPKTASQYVQQTHSSTTQSLSSSYSLNFVKNSQPFFIPNSVYNDMRIMSYRSNNNFSNTSKNQNLNKCSLISPQIQPMYINGFNSSMTSNVNSKAYFSTTGMMGNDISHINFNGPNEQNQFLISNEDLDNYMLFQQGKQKQSLLNMNINIMKEQMILQEKQLIDGQQYLVDKNQKINYFSQQFHDCFR